MTPRTAPILNVSQKMTADDLHYIQLKSLQIAIVRKSSKYRFSVAKNCDETRLQSDECVERRGAESEALPLGF